jgi:hypothetical protein
VNKGIPGEIAEIGRIKRHWSVMPGIPSNSRMKAPKAMLLLLMLVSGLSLAATDVTPTPLPPPVSLKEAVRVAEGYIAEKRIDVSRHYLASVRVESDMRGRLHWDAQWMHTDKALKGGWFIIRVEMDKTAALIPGK